MEICINGDQRQSISQRKVESQKVPENFREDVLMRRNEKKLEQQGHR